MNARVVDYPSEEMASALHVALRRSLTIKGSSLADDFNRCYGEPTGKLVRGMLTLKIALILAGDFRPGLPAACAVELLHLSGMIVDDWMDGAKMRRGKPTVASRYGPIPALAIARHLLYTSLGEFSSYSSLELLKRAQSTVEAMVAGQRMELRMASVTSWARYRRYISGKTAELFALASEAGALSARASKQHRGCARQFGQEIGTAFQIVDDHLDYFGSDKIGKHVGMDFLAGIQTAPLLFFLRRSRSHAREVRTLMSAATRTHCQFEELRRRMLRDGIAEETLAVARSYSERASRRLAALPAVPGREELRNWADGLVAREL